MSGEVFSVGGGRVAAGLHRRDAGLLQGRPHRRGRRATTGTRSPTSRATPCRPTSPRRRRCSCRSSHRSSAVPRPDLDPADLEGFHAAATEWLDENRAHAPRDYGAICPPELIERGVAWHRRCPTAGWAGTPLARRARRPRPHPGAPRRRGWTECAVAGVPPVFNMVGLVLAGGAILRFGDAASSRRGTCAPTLSAEQVWCQLFSEPGAGSDLGWLTHQGGARRRPLRRQRPEGLVLRRPRYSDWGILMARTNPDAPKHEGISFFLFDMDHARRRGATPEPDDRRGRVRRGVLHRRRAAGRRTARAAARRVGRRHGCAHQRARAHRRAASSASSVAWSRCPSSR